MLHFDDKLRILKRCFLILFFISAHTSLWAANDNIRLEVLRGRQIAPYIQDMAKLVVITFMEPPYLYQGSIDSSQPFFQNYANTDNSVACLLFDGNKLVGMAQRHTNCTFGLSH